MTHADKGRYAAKHGTGKVPDEKIAAAVRSKAKEGSLACAEAERISLDLGVAMAEVGRTLDLLEIRIDRCQLGLFGYPGEEKGRSIRPAAQVDPELEAAIRAALAAGRLPCTAAWQIAGRRKLPRMAVSAACEALQIKVKPCQLGAF